MNIKIQLFGMLAEAADTSELELSDFAGDTVQDLLEVLYGKFPALEPLAFTVANNQEIVDNSAVITANNNLALLPPFAGG